MKVRKSAYGFKCKDCRKFVYEGYDRRDKQGLEGQAVCVNCADNYEDREKK